MWLQPLREKLCYSKRKNLCIVNLGKPIISCSLKWKLLCDSNHYTSWDFQIHFRHTCAYTFSHSQEKCQSSVSACGFWRDSLKWWWNPRLCFSRYFKWDICCGIDFHLQFLHGLWRLASHTNPRFSELRDLKLCNAFKLKIRWRFCGTYGSRYLAITVLRD